MKFCSLKKSALSFHFKANQHTGFVVEQSTTD